MSFLGAPIEYVEVHCPQQSCGVHFAVSRPFFDDRVADRGTFWCPNAHAMRLGIDTPQEKQIRQLELAAAEQGRIIIAQREDIQKLRATVASQVLGIATAEGEHRP
jgi:hypothetical protein